MKRTWKVAMYFLAGASLAAGGILVRWLWGGPAEVSHHASASEHSGPTIEQVQALSELITTRVQVADVQETHLEGYTGGMKVVILVRGDFLLGVDLSLARFEAVDPAARMAVLVLPQPQASSPRLDHERTKVFSLSQSGLWLITPGGGGTYGQVIDRGYLDAQRRVAEAAEDPGLLPKAREQARRVLDAFFMASGWKITIRWEL